MSEPSTPQELPPAYMPPAYIASPSVVDQPALGLVLAFAALSSLPQSANMLVQILRYESLTGRVGIIALLMIGEQLLQLFAGIAIAGQWRARRAIGLAYLACALALVVTSFVFIDDVAGPVGSSGGGIRYRAVTVLEGIGSPLLVLIAPRWFGVTRMTRATALGGLLMLGGVSAWLGQGIFGVQQWRWLFAGDVSIGTWLGELLRVAAALVPATIGFVAGLRMATGRPARRMLAVYVITAIGITVAMTALSIIMMFTEDSRYVSMVIPTTLMFATMNIVRPALVWWFAKRETEAGDDVSAALPWIALWFVPQLVARGLMYDEMTMLLGGKAIPIAVLCGLCAVANIGAARTALRGEPARTWWTTAAVLALALLAVAFVAINSLERTRVNIAMSASASAALVPVGLLFATAATAAWLARRLTSAR